MTDRAHEHRHYIPAMGQDRLIGWYNVLTWLAGVPKMHRYLIERAAIAPGHDVLEIGCGTGNLAQLIKRRYPTATMIGLDPDPRALQLAKHKADRRGVEIRFDQGFAGELPYPDASFDRVVSSLMFHHLDDDEKVAALREVRRVLRPGGELHLLDFTGGGHPHGSASRRLAAVAGDQIPELMRSAGFVNVGRTGEVRARLRLGRCATFRGSV